MNSFFAGWYVIYTRPRHEKKVFDKLSQFQIDSFFPTTKQLRTWCDRKKYVDMPLFPSYVFVHLKNMQDYYNGLHIDNVLSYVRTGKQIARVKDIIINSIRLIIDHKQEVEVTDEHFQPGRQLTIQRGPLINLSCEVVQCRGGRNVLVRVNLLQRSLLLTLPTEYLMACSS